jgi:hypothetical protein
MMSTFLPGFIKNGLEYFLCYVLVAFILCYLNYDSHKIVNGQPRIIPSRETIRMTSILAFWGFFLLFLISIFIVG